VWATAGATAGTHADLDLVNRRSKNPVLIDNCPSPATATRCAGGCHRSHTALYQEKRTCYWRLLMIAQSCCSTCPAIIQPRIWYSQRIFEAWLWTSHLTGACCSSKSYTTGQILHHSPSTLLALSSGEAMAPDSLILRASSSDLPSSRACSTPASAAMQMTPPQTDSTQPPVRACSWAQCRWQLHVMHL